MSIEHINELYSLDDKEFIVEAYKNILNREPDNKGLCFYSMLLSNGHDKSDIIFRLAMSDESVQH
ncbi:DUF4214 domain-containing protein, partial [Acidithiobacillus ferrooxidans]